MMSLVITTIQLREQSKHWVEAGGSALNNAKTFHVLYLSSSFKKVKPTESVVPENS